MSKTNTSQKTQNRKSQNKIPAEKKRLPLIISILIFIVTALGISFISYTATRAYQFSRLTQAEKLTGAENFELNSLLDSIYEQRVRILKPLPYEFSDANLEVYAESAILIDVSNGNILFEKNADEIIPPASMTKLFAMYVVDEAVSKGQLSYDDIIPLPPQCWACNMPPHSSLMFLGEGQIVTLEELLLGLSICSGNDAAYALAYAVSGSMEVFIEQMNNVASKLGLTHTHFVEASGYSEENTTTAREMAAFSRVYLKEHPQSLKMFHSVPSFTYPKPRNMASGDTYGSQDFSQGIPRHITMGITQSNTNPLLGLLEGCDGLKTGYIDESGYNLSLTAERQGTRFLSVTMKGPGNNSRQGQEGRIHDGTILMEFAFSSFKDFFDLEEIKPYFIKVYGSRIKALNLCPAFYPQSITMPLFTNADTPQIQVQLPEHLSGNIVCGEEYGKIIISIDGIQLETIPLVADRSADSGSFITRAADFFIH